MKIDKAIEILTRKRNIEPGGNLGEEWDALKLGISALERCKYIAEHTDRWSGVLLPGETKE